MWRPEVLLSRLRVGPLPCLFLGDRPVTSAAAFSSAQPFAQLFPLFLPDSLTMYKMQFLKSLEIWGQEKKFLPKVTSLFPSAALDSPSHGPCAGALRLQGPPGAVDSCSFGPLSDFVFSCFSFRASLYGRSSLTSPIFEVTGMERLEIGGFFGKNKPFIYCH